MSETRIRLMREAEAESGIELVMRVFNKFVAQDFDARGIASFLEWANPPALAERLRAGYIDLYTPMLLTIGDA